MFKGMAYQNVLGKACLVIPLPENSGCAMIYVKEIDDYTILDAKHDSGVCVLVGKKIGYRKGGIDQIILRFNASYTTYDCRVEKDVDSDVANFAVIKPSGVVALINQEEILEVFSLSLANTRVVEYNDPNIDTGMILTKSGCRIMFHKDRGLYSLSMVKKGGKGN